MKALFFSYVDFEDPTAVGVVKKVRAQIEAFKNAGVDVKHVYRKGNKMLIDGKVIGNFFNLAHWLLTYWKSSLRIVGSEKPDFVYMRYVFPAHVGTLKLFRSLKREGLFLVVEFPTFPYVNESSKKLFVISDNLFAKKLGKYIDIAVTPANVSEPILGAKTIRISNGVDLRTTPKKRNKLSIDDVFNLIGVANVSHWHGFDRVIYGIARYYAKHGTSAQPEVFFHIVGVGKNLIELQNLARSLGVGKYVIFHGTKVSDELDRLFDMSHVAVGSLGNHRKGLKESSDLKTREYCARGIPFVISYEDEDFSDGFPYMLKVEATDEPIDINSVINFYRNVFHMDYINEMRKYAEERLSWDVKLKPLIQELFKFPMKRSGI